MAGCMNTETEEGGVERSVETAFVARFVMVVEM